MVVPVSCRRRLDGVLVSGSGAGRVHFGSDRRGLEAFDDQPDAQRELPQGHRESRDPRWQGELLPRAEHDGDIGRGDRGAPISPTSGIERSVRLVHEHLIKRLAELDAKENNLLGLVEDRGAVAAMVRTRLMAIAHERARVKSELAAQGPLLEAARPLSRRPSTCSTTRRSYRQTSDTVRRQLNEVFFDRLYLDTDEVIDDRLAAPFSDFLYPGSLNRRRVIHTRGHQAGTPNGAHWDAAGGMSTGTGAALLQRIARGEGLSKAAMVELRVTGCTT